MNHATRALVAIVLVCMFPRGTSAQPRSPLDLASASLEDLMKIEVTSASRKEERAADVPAAVFVITHDDIVRSGMTTLPDLLRLAPGVNVAQVNSNKWAVSVRGFNGLNAQTARAHRRS
jgi:iron complex outermembrane receptor protein